MQIKWVLPWELAASTDTPTRVDPKVRGAEPGLTGFICNFKEGKGNLTWIYSNFRAAILK